jgi:hypothetical protein
MASAASRSFSTFERSSGVNEGGLAAPARPTSSKGSEISVTRRRRRLPPSMIALKARRPLPPRLARHSP